MYLSHFTMVAWSGTRSSSFRVVNGVRQGAILSPVLFCVYFDALLNELNATGIGCHIGLFFVGAHAYAVGLVLLAPSANAKSHMLQICDAFAAHYSVIFNAQKSKCLCCRHTCTDKRVSHYTHYPSFYIGSQAIEFEGKWPHLGHVISNGCDDMEDILSNKVKSNWTS
jgi:Reverse transcriptase (RNA-dependent DNA polymerase)